MAWKPISYNSKSNLCFDTIALRGFAGLYLLSIDGLAEAGERMTSSEAFTGAFPVGLRMGASFNRCVKHITSRKPSLLKNRFEYLLSALSKNSF